MLLQELYTKILKFFILDEATNGLDLKVENEIIDTVLNLKIKITIIIISHNLKIIQKCEEIYEIKEK